MYDINENDVLTRVTHYNFMTSGKSIRIDIHEAVKGSLAGKFVAVPNLIMVIAPPEYQGVGDTEEIALSDCLKKIKNRSVDDIFPQRNVS